MGQPILRPKGNLIEQAAFIAVLRSKGNLVNIPEPGCSCNGNISELREVGMGPRKSFLFFLTATHTLKTDYLEQGYAGWQRAPASVWCLERL